MGHVACLPFYGRNDEYIAPSKAKAIKRLLVELCSELRWVCDCCDFGPHGTCQNGACRVGEWQVGSFVIKELI